MSMESAQGLVDGLKSATYELIALLLPGIVLTALGHGIADTPAPPSLPAWLVAGYVLGLVLQGAAAWLSRRRVLRHLVGAVATTTSSPAEQRAKEIVEKDFGKTIADEHLLDAVLTRVHPNRQVYDKFLALAATARALALVAIVAFALIGVVHFDSVDSSRPWLMLGGAFVSWLALCERHRRFAPLALKALYGKFVTLHSDTAQPKQPAGHFAVFSISSSAPVNGVSSSHGSLATTSIPPSATSTAANGSTQPSSS